ncbi:hypothetical protein C8J55DRAFT_554520 [Lentinula edodes]|uniref:Uncharacterized protein n=1 Tax=Lentinula lateritia TaxID=40482 RepID=A0A9W9B097_9AGAR|nr:hypothetical protein C8J55DRAFT_554520 [Lentinula edodes]
MASPGRIDRAVFQIRHRTFNEVDLDNADQQKWGPQLLTRLHSTISVMSHSSKLQMILSPRSIQALPTFYFSLRSPPAQRVRTTTCMAMGYSTSGKIDPLKGFFGLPDSAVLAGDRECEQEEVRYFVKEYCVQEELLEAAGTVGAVLHTRDSTELKPTAE